MAVSKSRKNINLKAKPQIVKIAGMWDVWEEASKEYLVHWRFMVKHFGVDTIYMTPISGAAEQLKNTLDSTESAFVELPTLNEVVVANPTLTPVVVDENGAVELSEFEHPKNALYIFGRVSHSPLDILKETQLSVRIPSWAKDTKVSLGLLHPHQAAAIVLYDRMINIWQ